MATRTSAVHAASNPVRFLAGVLYLMPLLLLSSLPIKAAPEDFPVPDNIRPAIDFWKKVYTQVDTESGYLHDSVDLTIIYETLPRDSKRIEARRQEIVADLKVLASGKREGLTARQQSLLDLWGARATNARLEQASGNVRWQLGQSDRYREGLVRSGAYRDHIEAVAREKGLPLELAALPHVESSFHPGAYSSVAASGMWQFMRETAQRFMRVDNIVDERLDPYRATYAAMDLLLSDYRSLGSWPLALSAYNHGGNGIARAVRETGSRDIGRIIAEYKGPRFGFASRNFYPSFIAALEVDQEAERHFGKVVRDRKPDFVEVEMPAYVDAAVLAGTLGVSIEDLRRTNPALQRVVWTGNKRIPKGFRIKLDRASYNGDFVASLNAIPSNQFFTSQIADVSYTVRSGDSLSVIARRYNTSIAELAAINQLRDRHSIRVGQQLILPQPDGTVPTLVVNDTRQTAQVPPQTGNYVVQRGDTVSTIARRFDMAPATLMALNGLSERSLIFPGQQLSLRSEAVAAETGENGLRQEIAAALADNAASLQVDANSAALPADPAADAREALAVAENTLFSDPGNYGIAADGTIEILTDETPGHYAEWLGIPSAQLLRQNGLRNAAALRVGKRLKLDFSKVSQADFETRRKLYHSGLQARYFASYRIRDTENYSVKQSEVLAKLARDRSVPLWLLKQYNPEIMDASSIRTGQVVVFPVVEKVEN